MTWKAVKAKSKNPSQSVGKPQLKVVKQLDDRMRCFPHYLLFSWGDFVPWS